MRDFDITTGSQFALWAAKQGGIKTAYAHVQHFWTALSKQLTGFLVTEGEKFEVFKDESSISQMFNFCFDYLAAKP